MITGGGTGIGRGLAEAFHGRGNQVVITGRRREVLEKTAAANPGMGWMTLDVGSAEAIVAFGKEVTARFPKLNVVIHNAGIMHTEILEKGSLPMAEATIATNLLGPIRLNEALLPSLLRQEQAAILTVSSGLAYVPLMLNPAYCATKAAIHSWTQSLRYQLKDSGVQVIELVPPYVQTELTGTRQVNDPMAMPLKDYIAETMSLLESSPEAVEILVERVKAMRFAEAHGEYDGFYKKFNETMLAARAGEFRKA